MTTNLSITNISIISPFGIHGNTWTQHLDMENTHAHDSSPYIHASSLYFHASIFLSPLDINRKCDFSFGMLPLSVSL
jgi:hypothetical protein